MSTETEVEGLWSVQFGVPSNSSFGSGIIVFKDGNLYGGDASYYYIGTYSLKGNQVTADIQVKHHHGPKDNVLGQGLTETTLAMSGTFTPTKFQVSNGVLMALLTKKENINN